MSEDKGIIHSEALDRNLSRKLLRLSFGLDIQACFQCGVCTSICPVRKLERRFNPRRIVKMALLGLKEELLQRSPIWYCSTCMSCIERCPQIVKPYDVINAIRNLAIREGFKPEVTDSLSENIKTYGRVYPIDEYTEKKRRKLGLPEVKSESEDRSKRVGGWD